MSDSKRRQEVHGPNEDSKTTWLEVGDGSLVAKVQPLEKFLVEPSFPFLVVFRESTSQDYHWPKSSYFNDENSQKTISTAYEEPFICYVSAWFSSDEKDRVRVGGRPHFIESNIPEVVALSYDIKAKEKRSDTETNCIQLITRFDGTELPDLTQDLYYDEDAKRWKQWYDDFTISGWYGMTKQHVFVGIVQDVETVSKQDLVDQKTRNVLIEKQLDRKKALKKQIAQVAKKEKEAKQHINELMGHEGVDPSVVGLAYKEYHDVTQELSQLQLKLKKFRISPHLSLSPQLKTVIVTRFFPLQSGRTSVFRFPIRKFTLKSSSTNSFNNLFAWNGKIRDSYMNPKNRERLLEEVEFSYVDCPKEFTPSCCLEIQPRLRSTRFVAN